MVLCRPLGPRRRQAGVHRLWAYYHDVGVLCWKWSVRSLGVPKLCLSRILESNSSSGHRSQLIGVCTRPLQGSTPRCYWSLHRILETRLHRLGLVQSNGRSATAYVSYDPLVPADPVAARSLSSDSDRRGVQVKRIWRQHLWHHVAKFPS